MKRTTARLLVTLNCNRKCSYCCNKNKRVLDTARQIKNLKDLKGYEEVVVTGGEPFLNILDTLKIIKGLKRLGVPKIYLHTAYYPYKYELFIKVASMLDGLTFTLHANSTALDVERFCFFQSILTVHQHLFKNKSMRLYVHKDVKYLVPVDFQIWTRVERKEWVSDNSCVLPTHEDLFIKV